MGNSAKKRTRVSANDSNTGVHSTTYEKTLLHDKCRVNYQCMHNKLDESNTLFDEY